MTTDVAIIGAGPAGITAAIYALRAGRSVTIFEKNIYGGQTAIVDAIENYPGFTRISGADFADSLYRQAVGLGAKFLFGEVINIDFSDEIKCISTLGEDELYAKAVIIANGLKRRTLGCEGEHELFGKGVSYCATCDGAFFKGKPVIMVGGGNTALEDALYLSNICKKVTILVRKDKFRGETFLVDSVNSTPNIDVMFNTSVKKIEGADFVTGVVVKKGSKETFLPADGVFVAIGYRSDNEMFENKIEMNEQGYFISDESCTTNIPGVYVAGDCRAKNLRQITTAVADGAVAGNSAALFVFKNVSAQKLNVR